MNEIHAIGHRIVQGGSIFKSSALVNDEVISQIEELATLAPLHNGPAALVIRAVKKELPNVPQVVAFDTAFHQTMPVEAYTYALPEEQRTNCLLYTSFFSIASASRLAASLIPAFFARSDICLSLS